MSATWGALCPHQFLGNRDRDTKYSSEGCSLDKALNQEATRSQAPACTLLTLAQCTPALGKGHLF